MGGLSPLGSAADGEVEDYRISVLIPNPLSSQLLADPEFPGLSMLTVSGSGSDDTISVQSNAGGLRATINGVQGPTVSPTSRVVIFGLNGDDDLRINGTNLPGTIDGGPGDDTIRGGNGPDLLFGRNGNDTLFGAPVTIRLLAVVEMTFSLVTADWTCSLDNPETTSLPVMAF